MENRKTTLAARPSFFMPRSLYCHAGVKQGDAASLFFTRQ
jgi:hypothetical protein